MKGRVCIQRSLVSTKLARGGKRVLAIFSSIKKILVEPNKGKHVFQTSRVDASGESVRPVHSINCSLSHSRSHVVEPNPKLDPALKTGGEMLLLDPRLWMAS